MQTILNLKKTKRRFLNFKCTSLLLVLHWDNSERKKLRKKGGLHVGEEIFFLFDSAAKLTRFPLTDEKLFGVPVEKVFNGERGSQVILEGNRRDLEREITRNLSGTNNLQSNLTTVFPV